ncbi:DUF4394 domain-containing protein [uncultured Nevskia sp.]|uniref:DUF4394 domain-containing protein n=1 Tax=uncultured Nevskia sp. TaxID=228950 RepID=UPI0025D28D31|nr:DUF4394 domain-containing protein [uncultured Nevskia sp.]
MLTRHKSWALAAAALFLSGCDSKEDGPPGTPPPTSPVITDSYVVTSANRLLGINLAGSGGTLFSAAISGLAAGETVLDLAFRPRNGLLYALVNGPAGARIVRLDPTTGAAIAVSTLAADPTDTTVPYTGLTGARFGIDFNPVPDRLRVISDAGQNLRINIDTGLTITDTALNGAAAGASGTAYTNAFNAACRTQQFTIDPASDRLLLQNPPNDGVLTAIGGLGLDVDSVDGFGIATAADGTNTAYAVMTTAGASSLYGINTATGAATSLKSITLNAGESAAGFATSPQTAATPSQAPGELIGLTTANRYVSFMRGSPTKLCTSGAISGLPAGTDLLGIDTRPSTGGIVGLGSDNKLYSLSNAGVAAALCPLATDPADTTLPYSVLPSGASFGVGFNPVPDRLRVIADNGLNLRINPNLNGAGQCLVTTDTAISGASSLSGAAYTNTVPAAGATTLYAIDSGADALVQIGNNPANGIVDDPGNPNSGVASTIGALGAGDVGKVDAFLIDGRNNAALLATSAAGATASSLYTVNLATGAATLTGTVGGGLGTAASAPLRGLALTTGTNLKVYALTSDNRLLSFSQTGNVLAPNAASDLAITGTVSGEQLLGMDFRPANGLLYAVSSLNQIYVINTSTGLATLSATLAANPADTVPPLYTTLPAGAISGVDFNPVPDRLRVVDSTGSNLRINVATGATDADLMLNGAAGQIVAAAYTNSYAGTTTTTLYDLDATTLYTQTPPNDGTLVAVGPLGVTASGDAGLDIAGGANGLVLAAINTTGSGPSDLYRVNLVTGAATPVGVAGGTALIGPAGGTPIRSIAIDLR